jgi:hypothetical protein
MTIIRRPSQHVCATQSEVDLVMRIARECAGSYLILPLCLRVAYLTVSRPDEMRWLMRQGIGTEGVKLPVGICKRGQAQKHKLVEWTPELRSAMDEAISLQHTTSTHMFGTSEGQPLHRKRLQHDPARPRPGRKRSSPLGSRSATCDRPWRPIGWTRVTRTSPMRPAAIASGCSSRCTTVGRLKPPGRPSGLPSDLAGPHCAAIRRIN